MAAQDPSQSSTLNSRPTSNSIRTTRSSRTEYELQSVEVGQEDRPPGYPGLSKFLDSEKDLLVFRRFGALGVRNILYRQDILNELEEQLEACDAGPHPSDTRRFDDDTRRKELMEQLHQALVEYEDAIRVHATLLDYLKPSKRQIKNLENYFHEWTPLVDEEDKYIRSNLPKDEFMTLADPKSTLFTMLESTRPIQKLFQSKKERPGTPQDSSVEYYSLRFMQRTYRGVVVLGSWIFLVLPICLLYRTNDSVFKLAMVITFLVTFSICVAVLTKAKDWEMLAANAAYAAVLVVFFQIES